MKKTLRVLNVEDQEQDVFLIRHHLSRSGYDVISKRVDTSAAMRSMLETQEWDLILCDYSMPQFDAPSALALLKETGLDIPFIIISGTVGEEAAVKALLTGADDYLMKGNLVRLIPAIERELEEAKNRRARRRAEDAFRESEDRYRDLVEHSLDLICTHDLDGQVLSVNQMAAKVLGYPKHTLTGRNIREILLPHYRREFDDYIAEIQRKGIAQGTMSVQTSSGEKRIWEYTNTLRTEGVAIPIVRGVAHDVTEQMYARKALRESEERYRLLFEGNPFPMLVYELETLRFLAVNEAAVQNYGYSREEFLSMSIMDIHPPEDISPLLESVDNLSGGIDKAGVWTHRKKDGSIIVVEITSHPLTFAGKKAKLVLPNDITERKQSEEALRKAEEKYRSIFENAAEGIFQSSLDGRFISVNPAMSRILGYGSPEELIELRTDTRTQHYVDTASRSHLEQMVAKFGAVVGFECEIYRKDMSRIWTVENIRSIRDKNGTVLYYEGSIEDITERKRNEQIQLIRIAHTAFRAEISTALAESKRSLQEILEHCTKAMVRHLGAAFACIWTLKREENVLELQACAGMGMHMDDPHSRVSVGAFKIDLIAEERKPHITNDVQNDPRFSDKEWAQREGLIAFAGHPLIVENRVVGVIAMFARQRIAEETFDALTSVADIISQGIDRKHTEEALRNSEEQLRQSQKLESIGQLAGGIAHDFNNLLTGIIGYSEISLMRLQPVDPLWQNLEEIKKAGERAAVLTRQLLAFSRKQVLQPKVLNINSIITDFEKMLKRLIGEDIELRTVLEAEIGNIKADPGQIEQVIMNLVVNARDAMPQGGKLTFETTNVYLDKNYASQHVGVTSGSYIMLAVSDTGSGMAEETKKRIFEPFFTTKKIGEGTGLGLSTVYGIIKQSGGNIWVYSELGHGTTFKVYLPRVDEAAQDYEQGGSAEENLRGTETILLAEDEEIVRKLAREVLMSYGYQVLESANGGTALLICERYQEPIHLLVTDVIMPEMSGRDLAERLTRLRPDMKVLFMSGYTDNAIILHGVLDPKTNFIQKPFGPDELAQKVREVLKLK